MEQNQIKSAQAFLQGEGYTIEADGIWGAKSSAVLQQYQKREGWNVTGQLDAVTLTLMNLSNKPLVDKMVSNYPVPLLNRLEDKERTNKFGSFNYVVASDFSLVVSHTWQDASLVPIDLSPYIELKELPGTVTKVRMHKLVAGNLVSALLSLQRYDIKEINYCVGGYVARMIRGSSKVLSNHAWGSAIDFNSQENWLGKRPATPGAPGCLYDTVMVMQAWGFYWGGWFTRCDGMHFEANDNKVLASPLPDVVNHPTFQKWARKRIGGKFQ